MLIGACDLILNCARFTSSGGGTGGGNDAGSANFMWWTARVHCAVRGWPLATPAPTGTAAQHVTAVSAGTTHAPATPAPPAVTVTRAVTDSTTLPERQLALASTARPSGGGGRRSTSNAAGRGSGRESPAMITVAALAVAVALAVLGGVAVKGRRYRLRPNGPAYSRVANVDG